MFYTPVTGLSALHKAAQRGDEKEIAALLAEVRWGPAAAEWASGCWVPVQMHRPPSHTAAATDIHPVAPLPACRARTSRHGTARGGRLCTMP